MCIKGCYKDVTSFLKGLKKAIFTSKNTLYNGKGHHIRVYTYRVIQNKQGKDMFIFKQLLNELF